ncbi:MAG TPA: hypothetical protein VFX98_06385, partial [Longimicrobiaceae bacterium]|nr:hypothetical protein [Longimicrobiaceae bacterium]
AAGAVADRVGGGDDTPEEVTAPAAEAATEIGAEEPAAPAAVVEEEPAAPAAEGEPAADADEPQS